MPRRRDPNAPKVVHRTARVGLRTTPAQRRRCFGLLACAGDVWACVLDLNRWRWQRRLPPIANFQELCRELHQAGPGAFAELHSKCAEGVLRRYSDAWFATAKRRRDGDMSARYPRRKRHLVPVRFRHGTFALDGRRLRLATARGCPALWVRLDRDPPYPAEQIRSVTLLNEGPRLYVEVTAEVPVATYPEGEGPDPGRVAGVDLGIIHPYAAAGPDRKGLLVSGRAIRAETHLHLQDTKKRQRKAARRAPKPGQVGSRRWKQHRRKQKQAQGRHRRRVRQAHHEAAAMVIDWCVQHRIGTLKIGDPRGVLTLKAGRRHNKRVQDWRIGHLISYLAEKAEQAGITTILVNERGSSSTCPNPECQRRVPKPRGRTFRCPYCGFVGHRDLVGGANLAHRTAEGGPIPTGQRNAFPVEITHRRAGAHLPGVSSGRRDPRRRPHHGGDTRGSPGRPASLPAGSGDVARPRRGSVNSTPTNGASVD